MLFSAELRAAFAAWSREVQRNSDRYVREQESALRWWTRALGENRDLRTLDLATDVLPPLRTVTRGHAPRIATLKRFCSWLYSVRHELERNPVAALRVQVARPEQWRRPKVVPREDLERTRTRLPGWAADAVTVLAGTGWHVTELVRFARAGEIEDPNPLQRTRQPDVAAVLGTIHKHGAPHRTCVSVHVREAAARVRVRGRLCAYALGKAVRTAALAGGVRRWTPGQLRHTVATWAVQAGEDLAAVADFLGHLDPRTTRRFYATHAAARKVSTPW